MEILAWHEWDGAMLRVRVRVLVLTERIFALEASSPLSVDYAIARGLSYPVPGRICFWQIDKMTIANANLSDGVY
jgi:hypothetical protein